MNWVADKMGDPLVSEFNVQIFSKYRELRLSGKLLRNTRKQVVTPRTVNLELAYFRAVFNELRRLGEWNKNNPIENVRAFRTDEIEMAFLTHEQIHDLLKSFSESSEKDLLLVVKIALSTGARWSEAESLTNTQITKYKITFIKTKGKRNQIVPISSELYNELPKKKGKLFTPCYYAFRSARVSHQ
ncbi:phage integrase [Candidatus Arsenophonus triatominarum]|uniref:phage integrase n=1 Tax=Candidatus Arsenophonus triatominarum TaxID=57911 RepID=UPI000A7B001B|nr:tyrosine-type recombinase/integrase [Candidatus Arsenophonus triatominarum]